jgi:hypothetical protein
MPAGRRDAARITVLRNKLMPWTRASALGCPNREESPAASTTIFNLGIRAFVAIIETMNSSRVKLQHRPFLTPIWVTAGAAAAAFLCALFLVWVWGTAGSTTVIVIPEDPAAGAAQAARLAHMFGSEGPGRLDAIYVSSVPRDQLIAAQLADRLHITLRLESERDAKGSARRALRDHGGGRVLIIAQPDMYPGIVEALSGVPDIPGLAPGDYGVIYVATVPRIGHANLLRLNY